MSRRTRIFLALIVVYAVGMAALLYQLLAELDPRYRESAEEGLVETAQLLAAVIEQDVDAGARPPDRIAGLFRDLYARQFSAQIYSLHKTRVELRAYVTNRHGVVVYDSTGRDLGKDYAGWRDVRNTLRGEYGARTTRDVAQDPRSSVMYVGAPIRWQGEIVGAVGVGKPVQSLSQFVANARGNIISVVKLARSVRSRASHDETLGAVRPARMSSMKSPRPTAASAASRLPGGCASGMPVVGGAAELAATISRSLPRAARRCWPIAFGACA